MKPEGSEHPAPPQPSRIKLLKKATTKPATNEAERIPTPSPTPALAHQAPQEAKPATSSRRDSNTQPSGEGILTPTPLPALRGRHFNPQPSTSPPGKAFQPPALYQPSTSPLQALCQPSGSDGPGSRLPLKGTDGSNPSCYLTLTLTLRPLSTEDAKDEM